MSDHHTVKPPRNRADKHVTVQTKPEPQIGILGDSFVCKMSAGQQTACSSSKPEPPSCRRGSSPPAAAQAAVIAAIGNDEFQALRRAGQRLPTADVIALATGHQPE